MPSLLKVLILAVSVKELDFEIAQRIIKPSDWYQPFIAVGKQDVGARITADLSKSNKYPIQHTSL